MLASIPSRPPSLLWLCCCCWTTVTDWSPGLTLLAWARGDAEKRVHSAPKTHSFSWFSANRSFFVVVSPSFCQHGGSSGALQAALGGVADAPPVWWKISSCYSPETRIHAEEKILLYWTLNGISPADDSDIRSSGSRHATEISEPVLRKGLRVGRVFTRNPAILVDLRKGDVLNVKVRASETSSWNSTSGKYFGKTVKSGWYLAEAARC